MDVFYYWKDHDKDLKADRIGYFRSSREKLAELAGDLPNNIWVFKTPPGRKGQVQLLARLHWSDAAARPFTKEPGLSYIFYDPDHADSVRYTDSGGEAAIDTASTWVRRHFPKVVRGNFQGENGQQALRGPMLSELKRLAESLQSVPFSTSTVAP